MTKKASVIIVTAILFLLNVKNAASQELTARWELGVGEYFIHNVTSCDYYFNRKWGVNVGLDAGSGTMQSYYSTGWPDYNTYYTNEDFKFRQLKFGVARRFFVSKFFAEPFFGLGYIIEPRNLIYDGDKRVNNGVYVTGGLEIRSGIEYNITKKWAIRTMLSLSNTDLSSSVGVRYSFSYKEK